MADPLLWGIDPWDDNFDGCRACGNDGGTDDIETGEWIPCRACSKPADQAVPR